MVFNVEPNDSGGPGGRGMLQLKTTVWKKAVAVKKSKQYPQPTAETEAAWKPAGNAGSDFHWGLGG